MQGKNKTVPEKAKAHKSENADVRSSRKSNKALYLGAGIVIIIVLVLAAAWFAFNSTTGSAACPCIGAAQMKAILNDSSYLNATGTYNTTHTSNSTVLSQSLPLNFSGKVSEAWQAAYTMPSTGAAVEEIVFKTDNPQGIYNLSVALSGRGLNSTFHHGSVVNGFTYSYIALNNSAQTGGVNVTNLYLLYGYKGGYALGFSIVSRNPNYLPSNYIAAELSSTV